MNNIKKIILTLVILMLIGIYSVNAEKSVSSNSIQNAIDALTPNRENIETVTVSGNFIITEPINLPSHTRLNLQDAKIKVSNNLNTAWLTSSNENIEIIGGIIDCNGVNQNDNTRCIDLSNVMDAEISGMTIKNSNSHALFIGGSRGRIKIHDNSFFDNGYQIDKTDRAIWVMSNSDVQIYNNIIINQNGFGIGLEGVTRGNINNNIIRDSRNYDGIIVYSSAIISIFGNTISNVKDTGIVCELSFACTICGNTIYNFDSQGIALAGTSYSTISGNTIFLESNRINDVNIDKRIVNITSGVIPSLNNTIESNNY